ncbi:uncharacterized protein LOC144632912 [Oculina patagonica]
MNIAVKVLLTMAFAFSFFNLVCAKPLSEEMPFVRSQVFNQQSQGKGSQPQGDAFEPEESNYSQESNITSDVNRFFEIPTAYNRTARSTHPCVSGIAREYDWCRSSVVVMVKCDGSHPACNHVIPIHSRPRCQTVYGYRNSKFVNKCPTLAIDCKCAE